MLRLIKLFQHLRNKPRQHWHGWLAEQVALFYLLCKGYRPLRHNWRGRAAEIDLLVWKNSLLVVVEVKFRRGKEAAHGALTPAQAKRLQHQAQRLQGRYPELTLRGDVLLVYPAWPFVEHHQNALTLDI